MSISIVVVDDHAMVREGLRALLEKENDLEVIGECDNGVSAVRMASELKPQIIVLDISLPDFNGVDAASQILRENPGTRIIALSMHSSRRYVLAMLRAGATGYILKESISDELLRAIRYVALGKTYLDPAITNLVLEDSLAESAAGVEGKKSGLTNREIEVLRLLVQGKSTREAAKALSLSTKTIDTHRRQIMAKLDLSNLADLTKYAIRQGLVELDE